MNKPQLILVVDDRVSNFDVIESLLFKENYDLKYSEGGLQALDLLTKIHPDLILLDVMMPGMDGIEVCQRIKSNSHTCHIPIVMVTALDSRENLASCFKAGADDFISKPINSIELRARVKSMLRIKRQYDSLKESLQMRDDMSTMLIHDLRNPVGNISFACELLLGGELSQKQRKKVEQILNSGQRLSALIDDLLIMAKMESGKLKLDLAPVYINNLIEQTASNFVLLASKNGIQLVTQLLETDRKVLIDVGLFRRLIENLLSNAIKFSPIDSHIAIKIQDLESPEQKLKIQVSDFGRGIKDELKQCIFSKYEIGTKCKNINQIGLGLAFCKMVVEAHQGKIFVEDNYPKGSIFNVQI